MQKIIASWLVLLFVVLPIDYRLLPNIGAFLSRLLLPINDFLGKILFDVSVVDSYDKSDSLAFYLGATVLLLAVVLMHFLFKKELLKIHQLSIILIGFLSYYLIRYGFDKIIGIQFYEASPNILHTKLGNISKDLLFWNTMGASSFYNWFMAISEILAGLLILFNRTRFLGLFFATGIMVNVFALNIGYDITVKYLSGLLLFSGIFLLSYYKERIGLLLGYPNRAIESGINFSLKLPINKIVLGCFLSFIIMENLMTVFTEPTQFPLAGKSYFVNEHPQIEYIHFHPDGYMIIQNGEEVQSRQVIITSTEIITNSNRYSYSLLKDSLFIDMNGATILGAEYQNSNMPLMQDQTHIYLEELLP